MTTPFTYAGWGPSGSWRAESHPPADPDSIPPEPDAEDDDRALAREGAAAATGRADITAPDFEDGPA